MMKPNLFVRIATLAGFTVLMSGFVAYKAGAFETDPDVTADSPVKDSVQAPEIYAPSSKSGPVFVPKETKDTSKEKQTQEQQSNRNEQAPNQNAAPPKSNYYMGGSKSKGVFTPQATDTSKPK